MTTADLETIAKTIRKHIVEMIGKAGSGHPGGSLSAVELMTALYFNPHIHFDPKNPLDPDRDYFVLSKGHVCPVMYAVIAELGGIECGELCTLRQPGSRLQGHPAMDKGLPGIEVSSGSLGYGLSIGAGIAAGLKAAKKKNKVYVLMGDGEQQEGSIWEAVMAAAHLGLDNLCGIVDCNRLQIDGTVKEIMNIEPLKEKYAAFGWNVCDINGHDFNAVNGAYDQFKATRGKPTAILARTVKGKGVSFMENNVEWHGKAPSPEQVALALKELA
ncbi:MAG: transketolase [Elusimicrobia bacterium]|nr:transketolase [Elusimicrobiota bacterium]